MNVSIIVPAYNAENTIKTCLESVVHQMSPADELIVVDDGSSDHTARIADHYTDYIIRHEQNMGLPQARQSGLNAATHEICVYFDADVEVSDGTLNRIKTLMHSDADADAITGTYEKRQPFECFYSRYKSYTTSYNMSELPRQITFLHGGVFAVRKNGAPAFDGITDFYGEDVAYGQLLVRSGKKIIFDPKVLVTHHHRHTFLSMLNHGFRISSGMARLYMKYEGWKPEYQNRKSFGSASRTLLFSTSVSGILMVTAVLSFLGLDLTPGHVGFYIIIWIFLNYRFFSYCMSEEESFRAVPALISITWIEQSARCFGIVFGFADMFLRHVFIRSRSAALVPADED